MYNGTFDMQKAQPLKGPGFHRLGAQISAAVIRDIL